MTADRSAIGILLDATELMIARDIGTGRDVNAMRVAFSAIAEVLGVKPPATTEQLKQAAIDAVARANAAPAAPSASEAQFRSGCEGLQRAAREWLQHHPYETDEETEEAVQYFESFGRALGPAAPAGVDAVFAGLLRDLLNGQGASGLTDPVRIRALLSNLRTDAVAHRSKLGDSAEVSTLRRKGEEIERELGAARDRVLELESDLALRGKKPRRKTTRAKTKAAKS